VIKSFASLETEKLFRGKSSRRLPGDSQRRAVRKLLSIHAAVTTLTRWEEFRATGSKI